MFYPGKIEHINVILDCKGLGFSALKVYNRF